MKINIKGLDKKEIILALFLKAKVLPSEMFKEKWLINTNDEMKELKKLISNKLLVSPGKFIGQFYGRNLMVNIKDELDLTEYINSNGTSAANEVIRLIKEMQKQTSEFDEHLKNLFNGIDLLENDLSEITTRIFVNSTTKINSELKPFEEVAAGILKQFLSFYSATMLEYKYLESKKEIDFNHCILVDIKSILNEIKKDFEAIRHIVNSLHE